MFVATSPDGTQAVQSVEVDDDEAAAPTANNVTSRASTSKRIAVSPVRLALNIRNSHFNKKSFLKVRSLTSEDDGEDGDPVTEVDPVASACATVYKGTVGNKKVWIGSHYNASDDTVTHDLSYSSGSSSSLGSAFSVSGSSGSWNKSSTTSFDSSATQNFPASHKSQRDFSYFKYGKYWHGCSGAAGTDGYTIRANGYAGGDVENYPTSVLSAPYCVPENNGASFTKATTRAGTKTDGVTISGTIGFDLSSQTGYNSSTKVTYSFGSASHLCGTKDYPGDSPSTLVAKN